MGSGEWVCGEEFKGHRGPLSAMCASGDGSLLVTGGSDHTLRLWNLNSHRLGKCVVQKDYCLYIYFLLDKQKQLQ